MALSGTGTTLTPSFSPFSPISPGFPSSGNGNGNGFFGEGSSVRRCSKAESTSSLFSPSCHHPLLGNWILGFSLFSQCLPPFSFSEASRAKELPSLPSTLRNHRTDEQSITGLEDNQWKCPSFPEIHALLHGEGHPNSDTLFSLRLFTQTWKRVALVLSEMGGIVDRTRRCEDAATEGNACCDPKGFGPRGSNKNRGSCSPFLLSSALWEWWSTSSKTEPSVSGSSSPCKTEGEPKAFPSPSGSSDETEENKKLPTEEDLNDLRKTHVEILLATTLLLSNSQSGYRYLKEDLYHFHDMIRESSFSSLSLGEEACSRSSPSCSFANVLSDKEISLMAFMEDEDMENAQAMLERPMANHAADAGFALCSTQRRREAWGQFLPMMERCVALVDSFSISASFSAEDRPCSLGSRSNEREPFLTRTTTTLSDEVLPSEPSKKKTTPSPSPCSTSWISNIMESEEMKSLREDDGELFDGIQRDLLALHCILCHL
eukprot:CAMPEP_0113870440 /NCGR_PEP_ID=MMETSP0780_2-20120614/2085_1 /TAXON_ID=652834 /ORGANISM="Palpitomonas bilix" /LENGTH=487 /DNA_ID=CAMNT_0000855713 /DNA_START=307 /DNA_END=1770 /DNA_ORIENTATION=- /assembly_acc=CAM_ASM_000599